MKTIFVTFFLIAGMPLSDAKTCAFSVQQKAIGVSWQAFKTPAKVGVAGRFKNITVNGKLSGKSAADIIKGVHFVIATQGKSIDTKDPARDSKIARAFFSTLKNQGLIVGRFSKIDKKNLTMNLTLNGVTKDIPLAYVLKQGKLAAKGYIDVLDFSMATQLAALNKACFAKHQGKTWSDVEIKLTAEFSRVCK